MAKTGNVPPRQEAPTYQRQSSIQPVADTAHLRYGEALRGHTAMTDMLGSLGQQIAQNLANEQAREKGIEAAKTPGRFLFPNINETTKTFNDSYRREEAQVLQFEAEKFLNNVYHESALDENPNAKTLFTFEDTAKRGIDDVLSQSKNVTPELKRHLEKSYESKYQHLSERVFDSNRKYLKQQNAAQLELNVTEMNNSMIDGNPEMSQSYRNQALQNIYTAAEQNNTPPEQVELEEKKLKNKFIAGKLQREYIDTPNKDKPKFIADLQRNPPEDMSPDEKDSLVAGMLQFSNKYDAAFKGEQYLAYNDALTKIETGTLTSEDLARLDSDNSVDAYQLSDLKNKSIIKSTKEIKKSQDANSIISNSNKPIFLSNVSSQKINETVDEYILPQAAEKKGGYLSLSDQAVELANFKAPVTSYQERLSAAIKDGAPEDLLDAAVAIKFAQTNNPALIRDMDKNDLAVANLYETISKNPIYQGQEGATKARDDIYKVDEKMKEARQSMLNTYLRDKKFYDSTVAPKRVADVLSDGFFSASKKIPAEAIVDYMALLRNEVLRSGNLNVAKESAKQQLKDTYQGTTINNINGEVMKRSPEQAYPGLGYVLNNDKVRALKDVVNANKALRENGSFAMNELDWENEPDTTDLLSKPIDDNELTIKINGKPRKVVISSDIATQFSPIPQSTWAFEYLDDNGIRQPIIDPNGNGTSYRWIPDTKLFESIPDKYPEVQLKLAEQERNKFLQNQDSKRKYFNEEDVELLNQNPFYTRGYND